MKKIFSSFIAILLVGVVFSQGYVESGRYRISFKDKNNSPYSLSKPQEFLSQKALERRTKYHIAITEEDIPVNASYIKEIQKIMDSNSQLSERQKHPIFCNASKWFNSAIFMISSKSQFEQIKALSFVSRLEYVAPMPVFSADNYKLNEQEVFTEFPSVEDVTKYDYASVYGWSLDQNLMLGTVASHHSGYAGQGMTIAVIDAGFLHVDSAAVFQKMRDEGRILFTRDVTGEYECLGNPNISVYAEGSHGMMVLSLIGGYYPKKLVGTAPQANFILLHSEENETEYVVEEDNWIAAAEIADSAGADIITTSLGYSEFDTPQQNYIYQDMNGKTARISRGADVASSKGMLVLVSAGNSGNEPWKYISAPADAESVLTVGATNRNEKKVNFSSFGPTSDGRLKPDVMALGLYPTIVTATGRIYNTSGGTSFSCPLMAGCSAILWQEFPDSSAQSIKNALMRSGDHWKKPNNKYGHGIPNVYKARGYFYARQLYDFLSDSYELPEFDEFLQKFYDKNFRLASDFVMVVDTKSNYSPSFAIRNHSYSKIDLPTLPSKGGKIVFMCKGSDDVTIKVGSRK